MKNLFIKSLSFVLPFTSSKFVLAQLTCDEVFKATSSVPSQKTLREKKKPDLTYRYYLKSCKAPNNWIILDSINQNSPERCGYSTQKPLALVDLLIKSSTNHE